MTDWAWSDGKKNIVVIQNPTITDRAAEVLARHFRPIGKFVAPRAVTTETRSPNTAAPTRAIQAGADTRGRHNAATHSTSALRTSSVAHAVHAPAPPLDYVQRQATYERRNFTMAGDAHGGGGKAPATPAWVAPLLAGLLAILLVIVFLNWLDHGSFGGRRTSYYDDPPRSEETERRAPPRSRPAPAPRYAGDYDRGRESAPRARVPSPQEVNRRAHHTYDRIPVDCDTNDGFSRVPGSNRCQKIEWIPGDD